MNADLPKLLDFVKMMVQRGFGLYGRTEMKKICGKAGIILDDQWDVVTLGKDAVKNTQQLLVNYGSRNLPAKMTAIVLAKKYSIPIPIELTAKAGRKRQGIFSRWWNK